MSEYVSPVEIRLEDLREGEDEGTPRKVRDVTVRIGGKVIPLKFNMRVQRQIEEELEMDFYELQENLNKKKRNTGIILVCIRLMGNEGLKAEGQEADLTADWLEEHMSPAYTTDYRVAALGALVAGWKMETDNSYEEKQDVVLNEIRKKNGNTD